LISAGLSLVRSGGIGFLGWAKACWQGTSKIIKAVRIDLEYNFKYMNTFYKSQTKAHHSELI
jgi:hypothetical protein